MTNIREVLALNLKKHRQSRGWSQAKLAEKTKTSTNYIGMLETMNKFPSSEMVQKLAAALVIDPTELFCREIDPAESMRNSQKAAFADVGEAVGNFLNDYVAGKIAELEAKE
jgi:transcriptional regulator with XRE-family HTH domain